MLLLSVLCFACRCLRCLGAPASQRHAPWGLVFNTSRPLRVHVSALWRCACGLRIGVLLVFSRAADPRGVTKNRLRQHTADAMPPARAASRDSSAGRAPDWRSEGPQLDPGSGQSRALCSGPGRAHHLSHNEATCNSPVHTISGTISQDAKGRGARGQPVQCMPLPRPGIEPGTFRSSV